MWCATCVAVVREYTGHSHVTVQLLLPPWLLSNVTPIKAGISTGNSANMQIMSRRLFVCCVHLLLVLCAVMYYVVCV
jgi:hypothetical protein